MIAHHYFFFSVYTQYVIFQNTVYKETTTTTIYLSSNFLNLYTVIFQWFTIMISLIFYDYTNLSMLYFVLSLKQKKKKRPIKQKINTIA